MNKIVFCFLLLLCGQHLLAQVPLDSAGRNPQYVATIIARSEKIVKTLNLSDQTKAGNVRNIIVNRYFKLNDIYARHKDKDSLYADLYQHHFEFAADLANYLDDHLRYSTNILINKVNEENVPKAKYKETNIYSLIKNWCKFRVGLEIKHLKNQICEIDSDLKYQNTLLLAGKNLNIIF